MFIEPMKAIGTIEELNVSRRNGNLEMTSQTGFKDIFTQAIQNVYDTSASAAQAQYDLATGQLDDAHTAPIEATKAQLSLELLVQLRNKSLEAYKELMQTNL